MSADRQLREELGLGDRNGRANGHAARPEGVAPEHNLTDLGNAGRLVSRHGNDLRYCHPWGRWLAWDGRRWAIDATGEAERRAVDTVSAIYAEAADVDGKDERKAIARHATASESRSRIDAMISLARARPGIPVGPEDLDADPWLLNTLTGTVDLRTGSLREHRCADLITKLVPVEYDPDADAPRFAAFLREVFDGDEGVIAFVQRFAGYSLTGSTEERALAILHGTGKNGKSTLVELLHDVLGDYARNTDTETVLRKRNAGVGNDVAALKGARFVSAAEVEQGRALAESKVKNLTGSDTVTARFLFAEPFDFRPEFKLWLSTNNKPVIHGTDEAIWDRIRLIPFTRRFAGKHADHALSRKLREEMPGVLAWMVRGCLDWRREGLREPAAVSTATAEYRTEMDTLAAFFGDRCVVHPRAESPATPLYRAYQEWCDENGESGESQRRFGARLRERGFESFTYTAGPHRDRKGWRGIGLRDDRPDDDPGGGRRPPDSSATADDQTRTSDIKHDQDADNATESAVEGPQSGQTADDRPHTESPIGTRETGENTDSADKRGPFFHNLPLKNPRVERMQKKGPQGPHRPQSGAVTPREGRLSAEQAERVKRLIAEGMAPEWARAEVMGNEAVL